MRGPLSKFKALVCEYKPYNRVVLQRILEVQGYSITMTPSLAEALAVVFANPKDTFDLMLVDVIPSENRMEWVTAVQKAQPKMLLLATSAYLGDGFLPPDCGLYLPKPFTSQELTDAIAKLSVDSRPVPVIPLCRIRRPKAA